MAKRKVATLGDNIDLMERSLYRHMDQATRIKFRCIKDMAEPDLTTPDPKSALFYDLIDRINVMWKEYQELRGFFAGAQEAVFAEMMAEFAPPATYLDLVKKD
jgi:hypothetical protein